MALFRCQEERLILVKKSTIHANICSYPTVIVQEIAQMRQKPLLERNVSVLIQTKTKTISQRKFERQM